MPSAVTNPPPPPPDPAVSAPPPAPYRLSDEAAHDEKRNFLVIALFQIIMRTGWIFKTESIVMPAVLDTITGGGPLGGLLRGCLPVLNRLGNSIPTMLYSQRLKLLPQKRWAIVVCTLAMSLMFLILSAMFWAVGTATLWWTPVVFLLCYFLFFAATGINNMSLGTLQGKLIYATRRGRLLLTANVVGAASAIAAVWLLMPLWLYDGPAGPVRKFDMIFGFTAICFAASAATMLLTREPHDNHHEAAKSPRHLFAAAWKTVQEDKNFRRLALVAVTFGASLTLFPHYQALARSPRLGLSLENIIIWVIVQNIGTALFSLVIGPLADRRGNRLAMRLVLLGIAAMPVTAIALSYCGALGAQLYPLVFLFIGLTPVGFKSLNNYTLEISRHEDHPQYLSTLGLCFAAPLLASPLLGWIVEATSFEAVFIAISAVVLTGFLLTFRLQEPRDGLVDEVVGGLPEGN